MKMTILPLYGVFLLLSSLGCNKMKTTRPPAETNNAESVAMQAPASALKVVGHTYTADNTTNFPNPERGWFQTIDPNYVTNTTAAPLTVAQLNSLKSQFNITLVRKYYMLTPWLNNATLPQLFLDSLQNDLNACRAAGFKLIPRFTYNWNQSFTASDAALSITTSHINQLMQKLNSNIDVVDHLQAGFVGAWAEWHSSSNLHVANFTLQINSSGLSIINALFTGLSTKRMIAMRYPHFFNQLYNFVPLPSSSWYNGSQQARMGFHNDGFAYSNTDFGTYSLTLGTTPDPQRDFMKLHTYYTLASGEPAGGNYSTASYAVQDLRRYHFSSLSRNMPDAGKFYASLKNGTYDSVSLKLGYRYRLVSSSLPDSAAVGGIASINYVIANDGFAPNHNIRGVELVLRNNASGAVYRKDLVEDPRYWFSGSKSLSTNLSLVGIPAGSYSLLLNLPDPESTLSTNPAYSIRLANTGLWEPASGYNALQHTLVIY